MDLIKKYTTSRLFLISLISAVFIIYPNIACLPWEFSFLPESQYTSHLLFFAFRYIYISLLIWGLLGYNLKRIAEYTFGKRLLHTTLFAGAAYLLYAGISFACCTKADCFGSILIFQFFVVDIICTFAGHVSLLYSVQSKKEQEIELLKTKNLQSRYDALTNQINPHFFFNSLNGLSALIRKKNDDKTQEYIDKLSDVFRYILQSEKKGLATLAEELEFVESFRYMMEVRFANKLTFTIEVDNSMLGLKLPVLSLLPLIDNVVVHNTIDSEHKMNVSIVLNEKKELVVSNPVYPKLTAPITNGTGIKNLKNRFSLLMNKQIRIEDNGNTYSVYLPLK